ncbi:MAG: DUF932 domain-containing protein [Actinomycetales bacterium]|nr:DUF932 domain-containing protein [Actinomycetales bacterium]
MSRESLEDLNTNVLKGFTATTGHAWHYDPALQGAESNHYPGAVPIEDVRRRLFSWQAVPRPVAVQLPATAETATDVDAHGRAIRWAIQDDRQAICRSDTDAVLGIFKTGYTAHQYEQWLLNTVAAILDDDLVISSAGLLRGGAVAWVQIEIPTTVSTPQGVEFRPRLLGGTSFDGSIATFWKRVVGIVVCDNTMDAAMAESGQIYKVKHTRNSGFALDAARDALNVITATTEDFTATLATLCATDVPEPTWQAFLDDYVPLVEDDGTRKTGRSLTSAVGKQDALRRLWTHDVRVAPWKGTAFGVIQAVNTWSHHEQTARGMTREDRNMLNAITGVTGRETTAVAQSLTKALALAA